MALQHSQWQLSRSHRLLSATPWPKLSCMSSVWMMTSGGRISFPHFADSKLSQLYKLNEFPHVTQPASDRAGSHTQLLCPKSVFFHVAVLIRFVAERWAFHRIFQQIWRGGHQNVSLLTCLLVVNSQYDTQEADLHPLVIPVVFLNAGFFTFSFRHSSAQPPCSPNRPLIRVALVFHEGKWEKCRIARCRRKQPPPEGAVTLTWLVPGGYLPKRPRPLSRQRKASSLRLTFSFHSDIALWGWITVVAACYRVFMLMVSILQWKVNVPL